MQEYQLLCLQVSTGKGPLCNFSTSTEGWQEEGMKKVVPVYWSAGSRYKDLYAHKLADAIKDKVEVFQQAGWEIHDIKIIGNDGQELCAILIFEEVMGKVVQG